MKCDQENDMPHAKASIGTTNYAVAITAGRHQLSADEGPELGGKDSSGA
jgi:putative redox protein